MVLKYGVKDRYDFDDWYVQKRNIQFESVIEFFVVESSKLNGLLGMFTKAADMFL